MKMSTKGQYAITALKYMKANGAHQRPMKLQTVSEAEGISLHYLEQLFRKLRLAGIVVSHRGPGGGYVLTEKAWTYKQVLDAVGEKVEVPGFPKIQNQINDLFQSQTLQ